MDKQTAMIGFPQYFPSLSKTSAIHNSSARSNDNSPLPLSPSALKSSNKNTCEHLIQEDSFSSDSETDTDDTKESDA